MQNIVCMMQACAIAPDNMDTLEGALIEPLAVGMHATELSNAKVGETAIVLGSGCIGLCTIMSLKARGVSEIYVADVMDKRLEKALEVGATRVFNSKRESIEEFAKTLPGGGADQVYECAGNQNYNTSDLQTDQTCRKGHTGWCFSGTGSGAGYCNFECNGRNHLFCIPLQKSLAKGNCSSLFRSDPSQKHCVS